MTTKIFFSLIILHTICLSQSADSCLLLRKKIIPDQIIGTKFHQNINELKVGDTVYLNKALVKDFSCKGVTYKLKYSREFTQQDLNSGPFLPFKNTYESKVPINAFQYAENFYYQQDTIYEFVPDTSYYSNWLLINDKTIELKNSNSIFFLLAPYKQSWSSEFGKIDNKIKSGTEKVDLNDFIDQPLVVFNNYSSEITSAIIFKTQNNKLLVAHYFKLMPQRLFLNPKNKKTLAEFEKSFTFNKKIVIENENLLAFDKNYFKIFQIKGITFKNDIPELICDTYNSLSNSLIEKSNLIYIGSNVLNFYYPSCFKSIWSVEKKEFEKQEASNYNTVELIRGPKGGCYYISSSGRKVYVDRNACN